MRGKRSKQYRKLMHQYGLTFGFRTPYQCLVDTQMIQDAARFNMDLAGGLARTVHGEVKPMITQCSIRHLYTATPKNEDHILLAKTFERRRCGHLPDEDPLTELECLKSVVDSKGTGTNKHRYVVASQDPAVRSFMRKIPGVPLIYISRSVMIMEPMAGSSSDVREREERQKFKAGLKTRAPTHTAKRARDDDDEPDHFLGREGNALVQSVLSTVEPPKKKKKGPKGPNPLAVKKPKSRAELTSTSEAPTGEAVERTARRTEEGVVDHSADNELPAAEGTSDGTAKKKRKRKPKPKDESADVVLAED